MEEGKDGRLGGWEMQVAGCKGRQGTGDGRREKSGKTEV